MSSAYQFRSLSSHLVPLAIPRSGTNCYILLGRIALSRLFVAAVAASLAHARSGRIASSFFGRRSAAQHGSRARVGAFSFTANAEKTSKCQGARDCRGGCANRLSVHRSLAQGLYNQPRSSVLREAETGINDAGYKLQPSVTPDFGIYLCICSRESLLPGGSSELGFAPPIGTKRGLIMSLIIAISGGNSSRF